jgi:hypothetical protein
VTPLSAGDRPSGIGRSTGVGRLPTLRWVPTPVGPAPRDPNDPDLWDWGEDDDDAPNRRPLRMVLVGIVVLVMILLLVVNLL